MRLILAIVLVSTAAAALPIFFFAQGRAGLLPAPANAFRVPVFRDSGFGHVRADWWRGRGDGGISNTPNRYNFSTGYEISKYLTGDGLGSSPIALAARCLRRSFPHQIPTPSRRKRSDASNWTRARLRRGAVRAFVRMESLFGRRATANTGAISRDSSSRCRHPAAAGINTGPTAVALPFYAGDDIVARQSAGARHSCNLPG